MTLKKWQYKKTEILQLTLKHALTFALKFLIVLEEVGISIEGVQVDQQGLEHTSVVIL